jgi:hypothetical protein
MAISREFKFKEAAKKSASQPTKEERQQQLKMLIEFKLIPKSNKYKYNGGYYV